MSTVLPLKRSFDTTEDHHSQPTKRISSAPEFHSDTPSYEIDNFSNGESQAWLEGSEFPWFSEDYSLGIDWAESLELLLPGEVTNYEDLWVQPQSWSPLPTVTATDEGYASGTGPKSVGHIVDTKLCFGMIHDATFKLLGDMSIVKANIETTALSTEHYRFEVAIHEKHFVLRLRDGITFAVLNEQITIALQKLAGMDSIRFEAFSAKSPCYEMVSNCTKASKAILHVDINIYGSRDILDVVSQQLSSARIYLQHPVCIADGAEYENPHFLQLPGLDSKTISPRTRISPSEATSGTQLRHLVLDVYGSLLRSKDLKSLETDSRVKTPLLHHQKQALEFMAQREYGPVPSAFSLWKFTQLRDQSYYTHLLTGEVSFAEPNETGGGILADDMGLGKSLTVLSNIVATLDKAKTFANAEEMTSTDKNRPNCTASIMVSRATLIVVPSPLLLDGWMREIEQHLEGSLKVTKYHGQSRESLGPHLSDSDIVLTTYRTLAADAARPNNLLCQFRWFRLVLDEAHEVRNQSTTLYRAVFEITAEFRWCLTGTPIQNSLEDLGSLVVFIRASPFDNFSIFRKNVLAPFSCDVDDATRKLRMLLDSVCLRRTKELLHLPEPIEEHRILDLSAEEKTQYDTFKADMAQSIMQLVGSAHSTRSSFRMFHAQLQLRLLCNHGTFQKYFLDFDRTASTLGRSISRFPSDTGHVPGQYGGVVRCSWCRSPILTGEQGHGAGQFAMCTHIYCSVCSFARQDNTTDSEHHSRNQCRLCTGAQNDTLIPVEDGSVQARGCRPKKYFKAAGTSTKIDSLIDDIELFLLEEKSIVFSSWTKSLDLVGRSLSLRRVPFARVDGSCQLGVRKAVLDNFNTNPDVRVLIMTTGTGAVGLNLTAASRVYILEPQWNPSVEDQAIGRALRLGQTKRITVVHYVMRGTVEEEVYTRQRNKSMLATLGWRQNYSNDLA